MIQEILKILNTKYEGKLSARQINTDFVFFFNDKELPISLSDGEKGDPVYVSKLIEREVDFSLSDKVGKINVKETRKNDNSGRNILHGSKRSIRRNRKRNSKRTFNR